MALRDTFKKVFDDTYGSPFVTVTGTYIDGQGTPIAGSVRLTPCWRAATATGQVVLPETLDVPLDGTGSFTVNLIPSLGQPWWWRIREPDGTTLWFDAGTDLDVSSLASTPPPAVQTVVPGNHAADIAALNTRIDQLATQATVSGGLRWCGSWPEASPPYAAGDVVRDGLWLMVAEQTTTDRPAPMSSGTPLWMMEDKTPELHTATGPSAMAGVRLTVDRRFALSVHGVRVWVADHTMKHTLWLVTDSTTTPHWRQVPFDPTGNGWVEIPVDSATFLPGMVLDVIVEVTAAAGATTDEHVWNFQHITAGLAPPAPSEIVMSPTAPDVMYVHRLDASLVDRISVLARLLPGTTITARGRTYTVTQHEQRLGEDFVRLRVAPTGVLSSIDRPSTPFAMTTNSSGTAKVGRIPMHWMRPWLDETITGSGLFSETGRDGLTDDMHGYGVDLLCEKLTLSEHWAVMSSGGGTH